MDSPLCLSSPDVTLIENSGFRRPDQCPQVVKPCHPSHCASFSRALHFRNLLAQLLLHSHPSNIAMNSETEIDMGPTAPELDPLQPIPFQLQFDKPIPTQVKIAEWNPEKDLLAMVTEDSKILMHRFNWQRLWMVSPGRRVTSLGWRPDGKVITVGLEDGSIIFYDVENGKVLKTSRCHNAAVVSLNWEEHMQTIEDDGDSLFMYEDRTMRFFPPPPRIPRMPGLTSGDGGVVDDLDDSLCELLISSRQQLNILCSGDDAGNICFSIFGLFPIGRINIRDLSISSSYGDVQASYHLRDASVQKVALSKTLSQLTVLTFGAFVEDLVITSVPSQTSTDGAVNQAVYNDKSLVGLHCLALNTSIFCKRKKELYQVALHASSIEDLITVSRASLSVMQKQWSHAVCKFHEKFNTLSSLIADHGLDSNPREEFLSFLFGARTSPPLYQFLVGTLGESGLKRVSKTVTNAGKELHLVVGEHLQPAAEIIGFRIGELKGFSRWRARYQGIGLDERLINEAMENAGMFLVHIERFSRVLAIVLYLFQNFFNWLTKSLRLLMSEPADQIAPHNSEHVILFLKFHLDSDLVGNLLEASHGKVEVDLELMNRVEELVKFGGFSDTKFLERTLSKQFGQLEDSFKEALSLPLSAISKKISCEGLLPLFPSASPLEIPASLSFNKDFTGQRLVDFICFQIPETTFGLPSSIGIVKGITSCKQRNELGDDLLEAVIFSLPSGYHCVDLALYKDNQLVLLLNEEHESSESPGKSWLMMMMPNDLSFSLLSVSSQLKTWKLLKLKESTTRLNFNDGKMRSIPHLVKMPLAVSASRGVACIFTSRKRALVYILDEDEDGDEVSVTD